MFMLLGFQAQAHEMTPAYPKFSYSHILGVSVTKMLYIRNSDLERVTYICTSSKSFKGEGQRTIITSRICSKVK